MRLLGSCANKRQRQSSLILATLAACHQDVVRMHAWEAIQRTLETIEGRINEDVPIKELADRAGLSEFYYQRLFSRLVQRPVREYIELRRLALATEQLRDCDRSILDIAIGRGFGSHETFTRAFKEAYGMTQTEFRERANSLNNFEKPGLRL